MSGNIHKPGYVKFRREAEGGLVYDHENYGYEDASLYAVDEVVIDVLEFIDDGRSRNAVESEFSEAIVDSLLKRGVLDAR